MSRPKILIIENSVAVTGALKAIASTSKYLQSTFSFYFIIPKDSAGKLWLENNDFSWVKEWRMIEISRRIVSLLLYFPCLIINAFRLKRTIRRNGIDLIHVNDLYNLIPPVARILGCKKPYICHVRFMPDNFPKQLFRFWVQVHLRFASKIVVVSEAVKKNLPVHEKIITIYGGLAEESQADRASPRRTQEDTHIFLYVANLIRGKGQNYAIAAFSKIQHQLPDWKLRFVGGDMGLEKNRLYIRDLKEQALKYGIEKKIEWSGFTHDVENEYKKADIVLNFSESESFSMTSLEALFNGRPLVVSDCGGPAEIITHEKTGLLVKNRDIDAMAEAMLRLASSPVWREEIAARGNQEATQKFSLAATSEKLAAIYKASL